MKGERVGALGNFDHDGIVGALLRVVLGELDAEASGLDADGGIALRIETNGAAENFSCDLVFLERDAGVIERMFGEVAKEFAERFGSVEAMTFNKFIYLLEALLPANSESVRHSHITGK